MAKDLILEMPQAWNGTDSDIARLLSGVQSDPIILGFQFLEEARAQVRALAPIDLTIDDRTRTVTMPVNGIDFRLQQVWMSAKAPKYRAAIEDIVSFLEFLQRSREEKIRIEPVLRTHTYRPTGEDAAFVRLDYVMKNALYYILQQKNPQLETRILGMEAAQDTANISTQRILIPSRLIENYEQGVQFMELPEAAKTLYLVDRFYRDLGQDIAVAIIKELDRKSGASEKEPEKEAKEYKEQVSSSAVIGVRSARPVERRSYKKVLTGLFAVPQTKEDKRLVTPSNFEVVLGDYRPHIEASLRAKGGWKDVRDHLGELAVFYFGPEIIQHPRIAEAYPVIGQLDAKKIGRHMFVSLQALLERARVDPPTTLRLDREYYTEEL
ncbi:MAG: hypothetical protein V1659_03680 [Candidatus Woesearchaeota archaeon]